MKRLALCCDGTWNHSVNKQVSNVEKLSRSIISGRADDDVVQIVDYVGGVGARGYRVDAVLGGAFGYGLMRNVVDGYRFLATHYQPGDEIYVVGFSRGAYTARSVVGMIGQVGLLRPEEVDAGLLGEAESLYRRRARDDTAAVQDRARFKAEHSFDAPVRFLGVFDTVGALGVPGLTRRRSRFHDVRLGPGVQVARQGLAIDERRITFTPCLWEVPDGDPQGRVQQVWFPGGHSDVGGGTRLAGLSDVTLRWMRAELEAAGLAFDAARFARQLSTDPLQVQATPGIAYRMINGVRRVKPRYGVIEGREVFRGGLRVLAHRSDGERWCDGVALADGVAERIEPSGYASRARNLRWWIDEAGGLEAVPRARV